MRSVQLLLLAVLFYGCGKNASVEQPAGPETTRELAGIPKEFSDTPGLAKTEIRDAYDRIVTIGYLLHGKKESSWVDYSPHNGMIKTVTTYVQDKKEGLFIEFDSNNQLWRRCYFHNSKRHGEYREYSGANVKEDRNYENGKLEGVAKIFYENGKILEESYYKNGLREGVSKWYDQNGNLTIEHDYKNGQLVKK